MTALVSPARFGGRIPFRGEWILLTASAIIEKDLRYDSHHSLQWRPFFFITAGNAQSRGSSAKHTRCNPPTSFRAQIDGNRSPMATKNAGTRLIGALCKRAPVAHVMRNWRSSSRLERDRTWKQRPQLRIPDFSPLTARNHGVGWFECDFLRRSRFPMDRIWSFERCIGKGTDSIPTQTFLFAYHLSPLANHVGLWKAFPRRAPPTIAAVAYLLGYVHSR